MSSRLDVSLVVKVSKMYYLEGLKQEDIARQIGISRSLISMILTEAKETGIVEITVRDPFLNDEHYSRLLASFYPGTDFIVIPTSSRDPEAQRKLVAQRSADVLAKMLKNGETIGLAWGRTSLEFVHAFQQQEPSPDLSVVPLIGGSHQTAPYFQVNEMVRLLAEKVGGAPLFIHAPALANDREERDMYFNSSSMKPIRRAWTSMDVIVSGIGAIPLGETIDRETYAGEHEVFTHLKSPDAVGDICARYFDRAGAFIVDDYYERIVGVPIEELRGAKNNLIMASGTDKAEAIVGVLRTGMVRMLVLDEQTAKPALDLLQAKGS
jgi:DNA-binding transcriptional regulator LsrR (DeoR family)